MDRPPWYLSRKIIGAGMMTLTFFGTIFIRIAAPEAFGPEVISSLAAFAGGCWVGQTSGQAIQDTLQARGGKG